MPRMFPFVLAVLLLTPACGDDDGSPSGRFAVTIEVVDNAGEPVPGLELTLWNDSPFLQDAGPVKAVTHVAWVQPLAARTRLTVEDIEGELVQVLTDEEHFAGDHWIGWYGRNEEDIHQLSGRYTMKLEGFDRDTGEVAHTSTVDVWMAMGSFREDQSVGTTNARGRILLDDMRLFPHLYDRPAIPAYDETGESMGMIELDEDMVVLLRDPADDNLMRAKAKIRHNGDHLVLVWNPVAKVEEAVGGRATAPMKRGEPPESGWALRAYPNPFN
ncbi:MAG: hypothetical protein GY838_03475 [bacterium]|nr:hypothetical protein [bacterium]